MSSKNKMGPLTCAGINVNRAYSELIALPHTWLRGAELGYRERFYHGVGKKLIGICVPYFFT
jgi:hypothetical protein